MTATIEQLVGEFIDSWNLGRRPDLREYLARADPAERDELADQLATWLEVAPTPAYDEDTLTQIRSEPALVAALAAADAQPEPLAQRLPVLRQRAGLAIGELARRLTAIFDLSDAERAADYLTRLERDELDERRLSRRLIDAIGAILRIDPDRLLPRPPLAAAQTFFRAEDGSQRWEMRDIDALSRAALAPAPEPMDELDRLFLGGPAG
jgi:transcriptional regulator with XRE-family HTH domain